jgi:hypothetical protein
MRGARSIFLLASLTNRPELETKPTLAEYRVPRSATPEPRKQTPKCTKDYDNSRRKNDGIEVSSSPRADRQ